jgi:tRNA A-37 threonylcarbamoyl transferase component Bud32
MSSVVSDIPNIAQHGSTSASELAGQIQKYRVLEPIGEGGMSVVYRGHDDALQREVAIKVMHRHLARDPEARKRFSREARAVARLTHRNIPEIYDFSSSTSADSDLNYLVTELVEGMPLSALLKQGPALLPELGALIVIQVAEALQHAHENQIIHRDVKPENILVGRDGVVKLTDFGIAQIIGLESMTMTGTLIGSPAHMAPEQIDGTKDLDYRVDVWALGTVLYMSCTGGRLPFDADNPHSVLKRIVDGAYPDPRRVNAHVDSALSAIIARCLQVDRTARYQTVGDIHAALVEWLSERGLKDSELEVRGMMADRDGYDKMLHRRLALTMMALGDQALLGRERHRALEFFGRVLTLEPDHPDAFERVRRLTSGMRTRQWVRRGIWLAAAAAFTAGAILLVTQLSSSPVAPAKVARAHSALSGLEPPIAAPAVTAAPETEPPEAAPRQADGDTGKELGTLLIAQAKEAERLAQPVPTPIRRVVRTPRVPATPAPVARVAVRLSVSPPAVGILLNGKRYKGGSTRSLKPGKYQVTLVHPKCEELGCSFNTHALSVRPNSTMTLNRNFRFEFNYPPASLVISCATGNYAVDSRGKRYACDQRYSIEVTSHKPRLLSIAIFNEAGVEVRKQQLRVHPNARLSL